MTAEMPDWLAEAYKYEGLKEVPGPKHNPTIQRWLRHLKAWWSDDETPWCGTFVAHCMEATGHPIVGNWFRAKAWADYGANLRPSHVVPGAILVFSRNGGGHVGFYVGENANFYYVLGGNQKNQVRIDPIAKVRCVAIRWPRGVPVTGRSIQMAGGIASTDEA